jgi:hypothetical protein
LPDRTANDDDEEEEEHEHEDDWDRTLPKGAKEFQGTVHRHENLTIALGREIFVQTLRRPESGAGKERAFPEPFPARPRFRTLY